VPGRQQGKRTSKPEERLGGASSASVGGIQVVSAGAQQAGMFPLSLRAPEQSTMELPHAGGLAMQQEWQQQQQQPSSSSVGGPGSKVQGGVSVRMGSGLLRPTSQEAT
jgi:hypothetical protein